MPNDQKQNHTQQAQTQQFDPAKFIAQCGSKSQAIRKLSAQGFATGEIAQLLGIKYQHARNVLITPVKNPGAGSKGKKKVLSAETLKKAADLMK